MSGSGWSVYWSLGRWHWTVWHGPQMRTGKCRTKDEARAAAQAAAERLADNYRRQNLRSI